MLFSATLLIVATSVVLLALGMRFLYEHYLHPAWRRQRRVLSACEKAFDEGTYRLKRLRVSLDDPSIVDLLSSVLLDSKQSPRYFTYKIEPLGKTEPDFSGMREWEIALVRHYLHRTGEVPHHGKEVLRPREKSVNEHSKAPV